MIKFEIIIITYNQENTIIAAFNSAINQTLPPCVVSVYDDCSTDNTFNVLKSVKIKDGINVEFICNQKNIGVFNNLNQAISNSCGDITCFLAGDDEFELDLLENIYKYVNQNSINVNDPIWIIPNIRLLYSNGAIENVYHSRYNKISAFELILSGKVRSFEVGLSHSAVILSKIRTDCGYQADNLKSLLLAKKINVYLADFFGYRYRVDIGVTYNSKKRDLLMSRRIVLNILLDEYLKILSVREVVLVKYELAKVNVNIEPSIKTCLSLFFYSLRVMFVYRKLYTTRDILLPFIPTKIRSLIKIVKNKIFVNF